METKLIQATEKQHQLTLPDDLAQYAEELGLGNFNIGVVRALRYAKEEQLHTMGRLEWWVREKWNAKAD